MRGMASSRWWRHAALACLIGVGCLAGASTDAAAATLPLRAEVRIDRHIDVAAFERSVALRYHFHFRKVVAADIDRDGDLDVVAATDHGFTVWVNDGDGRLTSQPPSKRPALEDDGRGAAWRDDDAPAPEAFQNTLPSVPLPGIYAHAPPALAPAHARSTDTAPRSAAPFNCSTPRAPPA
jgi:FG-GAP-like repeat